MTGADEYRYPTYASEISEPVFVPQGVADSPLPSAEEQLAELENSDYTEEEKAMIRRKLTIGDNEELGTVSARGWSYLSGFEVLPQEKWDYCVPACVRAALLFINGRADSQDKIAVALGYKPGNGGVYAEEVAPYMNQKQNRTTYVTQGASSTLKIMKYAFYDSVETFETPPIAFIKVPEGSAEVGRWGFHTDGHAICITGANGNMREFQVSDPNYNNVGITAQRHIDAELIYKAIQLKGDGYAY